MKPQRAWFFQSFLACFACNAVLVGFLLKAGAFLQEFGLGLVAWGLAAGITLALWLWILFLGRRCLSRLRRESGLPSAPVGGGPADPPAPPYGESGASGFRAPGPDSPA